MSLYEPGFLRTNVDFDVSNLRGLRVAVSARVVLQQGTLQVELLSLRAGGWRMDHEAWWPDFEVGWARYGLTLWEIDGLYEAARAVFRGGRVGLQVV